MKSLIRNLEKEYLAIAVLVIGILLVIFPEQFAKAFPWVLGIALILRAVLIMILTLHYKDSQHGPGKAIVYGVMGLTIMIRGSEATGIIGVIWAVYTLMEVSGEIDEMWEKKHVSAVSVIVAAVSVGLAVMLMTDPLTHFISHVRILGLEICTSCAARRFDLIRQKRA